VKWPDMSSTIYASKKRKRTAEKDDDSGVDDFADESDANEGDEQLDSEESEGKDDGNGK
jgi:hypothetical protein